MLKHQNRRLVFAVVAALALSFAGAANAQPALDASAAPAGTYTLDLNHTAVIARVPHAGFSYEVFRFAPVSGELVWNPAAPASDSVNVVINAASIQTPVAGFSEELSGARFLNVAQFPQATFVSTAFRQTDASHGEVDGTLTIKGVAKQVMFAVELVGAGQNQRGAAVIGFHATTTINNADYSLPGFITGQTQLVIDAEFGKR